MHLWRKLATAEWLRENEEQVRAIAGDAIAIISRPSRQRLQIECWCRGPNLANQLHRRFGGSIQRLPRNWQQQVMKTPRRQPIRVGKRLLITQRASRRSVAITRRVLVIPAGLAFGTGEHSTTAMCLRLLEHFSRGLAQGWKMLDVGTGSGILALAAHRFGARRIKAFDNDPQAIATARQNAALNHISGIKFSRQEVTQWRAGERFDIITANLFSELLVGIVPKLRRSLKTDGALIVSGVLRNQETGVIDALEAAGFTPRQSRRRGKWIALLVERREDDP
jgi:ribosomal protein L11 methyltransferase